MKTIALQLTHAGPETAVSIAIDGALVARKLGLETEAFRQLMDNRKVSVLCERGIGQDAGLYRATFYFEDRRFRAIVESDGRIVQTEPP
ncbi:DUF6522 family protein [Agrilutibacter solisilvae]|uniref:DUF6522 family protein n=1 Tax=Agrilutibacter solisilvae TaxID=2763317 RepID=UPI001FD6C6B7|nr:DUF6522 family protein [Lysobacter solisilvae]